MGVFGRVMEGLAVESADPKTVMISGFCHALLAIDVTALPGGGGKACIRCDLAPVVEVAEQAFRVQYCSGFRPNSSDAQESGRFFRRFRRLLNDQGISLGFDSFDLCEYQFEPVKLSTNFGLQVF